MVVVCALDQSHNKENTAMVKPPNLDFKNQNNLVSNNNNKTFNISPNKTVLHASIHTSPVKSPTLPIHIMPLKESTNIKSGAVKNNLMKTQFQHNNEDEDEDDVKNEDTDDEKDQFTIYDYNKRLTEINDLSMINRDLIRELEIYQEEINNKNQLIDFKSIKISDLMHENTRLLNEIKNEREINEKDFDAWLDLKTDLELQIFNLNELIANNNLNDNNIIISEKTEMDPQELYNKLQLCNTEINKLTKKVTALKKENELEVQSKFMIIEELEMMRERYLEADKKHELLKLDYNDLANELLCNRNLSGKEDEESEEDSDYEEDLLKSENNEQISNSEIELPNSGNNNNNNKLKIKKKRKISSKSSSNDSNYNEARIASFRNSSLNKAILDVELKSQQQKYIQEISKRDFEVNSLKLYIEKLQSFIGFIEQKYEISEPLNNDLNNYNINNGALPNSNKNNERVASYDSTSSNKTATIDDYSFNLNTNNNDINNEFNNIKYNINNNNKNSSSNNYYIPNIEYSDAINIESAKKNLKNVMKSVSAYQLKPVNNNFNELYGTTNSNNNISNSNNNRRNVIKSIELNADDGGNDSYGDMNSFSTDYNQGEMEYLDIEGKEEMLSSYGCGDEIEFGDDELDLEEEEEEANDNNDNNNNSDEINKEDFDSNRLFNTKNNYSSTNSLNVSFKLSLTPQVGLNKNHNNNINNSNSNNNNEVNLIEDNNSIRKRWKKMTKSEIDLNLGIKSSSINNYELYKDLQKEEIDSMLKNMKEKEENNKKEKVTRNIYQISEEEEEEDSKNSNNYEYDYDDYDINDIVNNSEEEEEEEIDDDYEDDTINISNQEIQLFKMVFNRLYCSKHSMFQCFCKSSSLVTNELIDPITIKLFSSPFYLLTLKMRDNQIRKNSSFNSLKLRSELATKNCSHPMRYYRHEQSRLQRQLVSSKDHYGALQSLGSLGSLGANDADSSSCASGVNGANGANGCRLESRSSEASLSLSLVVD